LHRRATYEHVIADISTRLIDTQPHEIDGKSTERSRAVPLVHADRAYLVVLGDPTQINKWCREGITFPPSWPIGRQQLCPARPDGKAPFASAAWTGCRPARTKTPYRRGVRGWACVSNMGKGGVSAVLALTRSSLAP